MEYKIYPLHKKTHHIGSPSEQASCYHQTSPTLAFIEVFRFNFPNYMTHLFNCILQIASLCVTYTWTCKAEISPIITCNYTYISCIFSFFTSDMYSLMMATL